jgi:hypothetical protein
MNNKLPPKAHKELEKILLKQFKGKYPKKLVDDLGITLLNLSAIVLKRKIIINKKIEYMEITTRDIKLCKKCNNYRGIVEEKYNGKVSVYCACDLKLVKINDNEGRSPSMVSPDGKKLWWTPISKYKAEDGRLIHVPYFGGPNMNK